MMDNYVTIAMKINNKCGHCGFEMQSALPFDGNNEIEIKPGDLLICDKCLGLNTVDENANFIKASQEYLDSIPAAFKHELDKLIDVMKSKRAQANN